MFFLKKKNVSTFKTRVQKTLLLMAKNNTLFMSKMAENHTLWGCTYLIVYIRELPSFLSPPQPPPPTPLAGSETKTFSALQGKLRIQEGTKHILPSLIKLNEDVMFCWFRYSCTAFAYGQTGSGKTYTITGPLNLVRVCSGIPWYSGLDALEDNSFSNSI